MIQPQDVKRVMARHLLVEGFDLIFDPERSQGSWFVDARDGERYLDFFSMYAAMAVGYNHPRLLAARDELGRLAVNKPSNPDVYSVALAEFVDTFARLAMPAELPHAFFIEGGALAVENALKTAFDWKTRKVLARGGTPPPGQVIHFRQAFHGRSGYTLSLTNTADRRKTEHFPVFDWPRIVNPCLNFPLDPVRLEAVRAVEAEALAQIEAAVRQRGEAIAALVIEPIQGEGGDNHFRGEFLQALRALCDRHEIMLAFDEVQTGMGLTGRFWAFEHFGVQPDLLAFGKKSQVCGILASRRVEEVPCHVFQQRSRLNSTFGGNLVDMVRCSHILRIIEAEGLVDNARRQGERLLAGLQRLATEFPQQVANPRGRGLMCALDLPDGRLRDQLVQALLAQRLLLVGSGERSVRFRPHLVVTAEEIDTGLAVLQEVLRRGDYPGLPLRADACPSGV